MAVRQLAYGVPCDLIDDYMHMSESTCHEAMYMFCEHVIMVFDEYYVREPNIDDTLSINKSRGFSRMLSSIGCMHRQWKNCPFDWQRQFKGHKEGCTIIFEAVGSQNLWILHSFFGMGGSNNDINVLHRSLVFSRLIECTAP
jgi:hypothetical protein